MLKILDYEKVKDLSLEISSDKKISDSISFILSIQEDFSLSSDSRVLSYQNTNYENHQFILKDFIYDVNSFASLITTNILNIYKNAPEIICSEPIFNGFIISPDSDFTTIENITVKKLYCDYLNRLNSLGMIVYKFLYKYDFQLAGDFSHDMQFKKGFDCILDDDKNIKIINFENIFSYKNRQEKRTPICSKFGKKIKNLIEKHKSSIDSETLIALNFFSNTEDQLQKLNKSNTLYSVNLYDEKIIPKNSNLYTYCVDDFCFDIVALDSVKVTSNSISTSYGFKCSFDISYYIKKYLIETYTKKDLLSFICIYKDFLAAYDYNSRNDKSVFSQSHPMIKEANLLNQVDSIVLKYKKRLLSYFDILSDLKKQDTSLLFILKPTKDWCNLLSFPDSTKKHFLDKFAAIKEPSLDEFKSELVLYSSVLENMEILAILDDEEKNKMYSDILSSQKYINESVQNILEKFYSFNDTPRVDSFDSSSFYKKKEVTTFHTPLKDGIFFDCRDKSNIIISDSAIKNLSEDVIFSIKNILLVHKYHDYLEIDKDLLSSESLVSIENILFLLDVTNKFSFQVSSFSSLKFRKLRQYKAIGIYFSYTKQMGLDYRVGIDSYMHEMAHHIDLNTENLNRKRMVDYLYSYFNGRVEDRADYYLKSEELIARAGEISLVLLFGRYDKYKSMYDENKIDELILIQALEDTFAKSPYSKLMHKIEDYKALQYFDYRAAILNKDFKSIDYFLIYFKAFWSGKNISSADDLKLPSKNFSRYSGEKTFSKKTEKSYDYFYRNIYKDFIKFI